MSEHNNKPRASDVSNSNNDPDPPMGGGVISTDGPHMTVNVGKAAPPAQMGDVQPNYGTL